MPTVGTWDLNRRLEVKFVQLVINSTAKFKVASPLLISQ